MIQIITGKLGAGKTLWSSIQMFNFLCEGRTIVTNIDLDWEYIKRRARRKKRLILDDKQLIRVDPATDRRWQENIPFGDPFAAIEVWLDEVHLFYNARDWQKSGADSGDLFSFLTQSRKAGVNVSFIVQDEATLEKQFRLQAEWLRYVVNSDHLPLGPLGKFPFKFFVLVTRDAKAGHVISRRFMTYDKSFFGTYKTHSFLDPYMQQLASTRERVARMSLVRVSWFRWLLEEFQHNVITPILKPFRA